MTHHCSVRPMGFFSFFFIRFQFLIRFLSIRLSSAPESISDNMFIVFLSKSTYIKE